MGISDLDSPDGDFAESAGGSFRAIEHVLSGTAGQIFLGFASSSQYGAFSSKLVPSDVGLLDQPALCIMIETIYGDLSTTTFLPHHDSHSSTSAGTAPT